MQSARGSAGLSRFVSDYGMLGALVILCAFFSWRTWDVQHPTGAQAGRQVAAAIRKGERVFIAAQDNDEDRRFARAIAAAGVEVVDTVHGTPRDARLALERIAAAGGAIDVVACNHATAAWPVFQDMGAKGPPLSTARLARPRGYRWPNFLKTDNLVNVANQIVVIAIVAIGMTMVIVTGGIDLSVGSLIALSAVSTTLLIAKAAGAEHAGAGGMALCCGAGILVCAALGLFSGAMYTLFAIPPFIVTLAMMLVASGLAYLLAQGQSIYQVPDTFVWLGRGTAFGGLPISVILMIGLYGAAHVVMSRMALGRYIYAVGGNREAARLSGVPVVAVLLFVYTLCGALAGLGGVVTASQLKSGSPNYGLMYELYAIAAVVVGGTSLSGGEGKIFGTLIGAFIIAVIQNGMNLTGVESYTQKVVLGLVILGAVLFDQLRRVEKMRWRS